MADKPKKTRGKPRKRKEATETPEKKKGVSRRRRDDTAQVSDTPPRKRGASREGKRGVSRRGDPDIVKKVGNKAGRPPNTRPSNSKHGVSLTRTAPGQVTAADVLNTALGPPYDDSKRTVARILFISGAASLRVISEQLIVPRGTINWWYTNDHWAKLRREVRRFSAKESVRTVRRAMGRHVKKIDKELSDIVADMNDLITGGTLKPVTTQSGAMRLKMEALRLKIALFRAITYGSQGRAMAPDPSTVVFEGTEEQVSGMLCDSRIETLLDAVPTDIAHAIELVEGMSMDEVVSPEVIDAVNLILEKEEQDLDAVGDDISQRRRKRREAAEARTLDPSPDDILTDEEDDIEFGFDDDIDTDDAEETPKKEDENEQEQDPS